MSNVTNIVGESRLTSDGEIAMVSLFKYALSLDSVQKELINIMKDAEVEVEADEVSGLESAIEAQLENFEVEVEADNVSGLESMIESKIEEASIQAENVEGLENTVKWHLENLATNEEFIEKVVQGVVNTLVQRFLRK